MKRILVSICAAALLAGGAGVAQAAPYDHHNHYDRYQHNDWHSDWQPGHRMDSNSWRHGARVDYRRYHLRAPPRGYEWREVNGRFVLAAVTTGLILSIIAGAH